MAVFIVTGVPGAGKSSYACNNISQYCKYEPVSEVWFLPKEVKIFARMANLKVKHRCIEELLSQQPVSEDSRYKPEDQRIISLFNVETWRELVNADYSNHLIIDEAQTYFSSQARLPDSVWFFFEYHRHLGLDIYICTQSAKSLNHRLVAVADSYIEASPPGLKTFGVNTYLTRDKTTNQVVARNRVKIPDNVYKMYQSSEHKDGEKKVKSRITPLITTVAILIIGVIFGLKHFFTIFEKVGQPEKITQQKKKEVTHEREQHKQQLASTQIQESQNNKIKPENQNNKLSKKEQLEISVKQLNKIATFGLAQNQELPDECIYLSQYRIQCGPYQQQFIKSFDNYHCENYRCTLTIKLPVMETDPHPKPNASAVLGVWDQSNMQRNDT